MGEFRMPSLGADMDVGTIIEWLVQPGDEVTRGQIVAVVDTAKAAIEIESFEAGIVQEILVPPGRQVPVGTPLALIGSGVPVVTGAVGASAQGEAGAPRREQRQPAEAGGRATPPVRHLAHQLGVDLGEITATGPDGRVTHDDVIRSASPAGAGRAPTATRAGDTPSPLPDGDSSGQGPAAVEPAAKEPAAVEPASSAAAGAPSAPSEPPGRLRVTPRARRLAGERGIDLGSVAGTGAGGAVLSDDVQRAVSTPPPGTPGGPGAPEARAPAGVAPTPPDAAPAGGAAGAQAPSGADQPGPGDRKAAMRTAIARLMSRSNADIPHYYVTQTLDLGPAMTWLREHNADLPARRRLVPTALFLRATALAAQAVPDLNGHWIEGALRPADRVDLGVAVATRGGGLVTPAIPDAGGLAIDDLMARLADLVARARRGKLTRAEMAGASITVSALGEDGPDALYGVIFPPQVALVGIGGIVQRPWAVDGMLAVRPTVTVVLAADHRASDGRTASAFLAALAHPLEHPEEL